MAATDPSSDAQDGDDERGRRRSPDGTDDTARGAATGGIDLDRLRLESEDGLLDPGADADELDEADAATDRPDDPGDVAADGAAVRDDPPDGAGAEGAPDRVAGHDAPDGVVGDRPPAGSAGDGAAGRASVAGGGSAQDDGLVQDAPSERATRDGASEPVPGRPATSGADTARTDADDRDAGADDPSQRSGAARTRKAATAVAPVASARTLTALDPGMRLADRLESDRVVTAPANRQARSAALVAMFVGLGLLVLAQRSVAAGGDADLLGIPAGWLGALLALAGAVAWGLLAFYGPQRVLDLELAPDQQQQWEEVEAQARMTRSAMSIGTAAAAGGLVVTALALSTAPDGLRLGAVGFGLVIAVAGGLLLGFAYARRGPLRLLYLQTLVLARLERTGVGREVAADPKTADVLMALDALLGELPESSVRRFLSKPEAEWYLDMVARIREGKHG